MKRITFYIAILLSLNCYSQNFSGEIIYDFQIVPKVKSELVDSLITDSKGVKIHYLITDNFYKSTKYKNGKTIYSYTYDQVSKRMYDDYANMEYITYRDSRKSNTEYYGSEVFKDSIEVISGLRCFMVKYDAEYGKSISYYSDEVKVNYESFKDHNIGNWYESLKEVDGCISIKNITEYENYSAVRKAIDITSKELKPKDFELPNDKIIVASYLALDERAELIQPTTQQIELFQDRVQTASKKLNAGEKYLCYLRFVLTKDGEIKYLDTYKKGSNYFDKKAIEIFKECNFKFIPGVIDGRDVSSQVYFPIEFKA